MTSNPTSEERTFAVIVHSKEMLASDKSVFTKASERFWVTIEHDNWVEATSSQVSYNNGAIPVDLKTFESREEAEKFARRWKGHPWWCSPNGTFEVVEVIPRKVIEAKIVGYEVTHG